MKRVLCFGDSNTWGYNPKNGERFPKGVRWTSILQNKFIKKNVEIVEEGLCGRTSVFEDSYRAGRKGIDALAEIFQSEEIYDEVILMLGTNDCKSCYNNTAETIAEGVARCLQKILQYVAPEHVLLVSPISLGEKVWKSEFDPEFNQESILVSHQLKKAYKKVAETYGVHFLAASDYVQPSETDQEHLNAEAHQRFAEVIYEKLELDLINIQRTRPNKCERLSA